jgi:hypothetical protein
MDRHDPASDSPEARQRPPERHQASKALMKGDGTTDSGNRHYV